MSSSLTCQNLCINETEHNFTGEKDITSKVKKNLDSVDSKDAILPTSGTFEIDRDMGMTKMGSLEDNLQQQMDLIQSRYEMEKKEREKAVLRREEALALADEKTIEVVCAVSLLEYNQRQHVMSIAEIEEQKLQTLEIEYKAEIQRKKDEAAARRFEAVNNLIQLKKKASEMKKQALSAVNAYENSEKIRLEEKASLESSRNEIEGRNVLLALQKQKDAAKLKREEAEKKAAMALQRATEMRQKASLATEALREKSGEMGYDITKNLGALNELNCGTFQSNKEKVNDR